MLEVQIHGLNYDYPSHHSLTSLCADGAARPLNGDRGVGGKFPKQGVPSPGASNTTVAGACIPPASALPGAYKPEETPSPAGVPENMPEPPEGVRRLESGGGTEVGEY